MRDGGMLKGLIICSSGHRYSDVLSECPYCHDSEDYACFGVDYSEEEDVTAYTVMEGKEIKEVGLVCKCCQKTDIDVKLFECSTCGFKSVLCEGCITSHVLDEHT